MTDNITVNNVPTSAVGGGADFSSNGEQVPQVIKRWDDLDLKESLLRGIYAYGFENPSEIQKKAIPAILTGRDTIGQAQSGCGKTGTFAIGLLQRLDITSPTTSPHPRPHTRARPSNRDGHSRTRVVHGRSRSPDDGRRHFRARRDRLDHQMRATRGGRMYRTRPRYDSQTSAECLRYQNAHYG